MVFVGIVDVSLCLRHVPVPHDGYYTIAVSPVFHRCGVGIVNPVGITKRLTPVEEEIVEAGNGRISACAVEDILGCGCAPTSVFVGRYCTREHGFAKL